MKITHLSVEVLLKAFRLALILYNKFCFKLTFIMVNFFDKLG